MPKNIHGLKNDIVKNVQCKKDSTIQKSVQYMEYYNILMWLHMKQRTRLK
jgi:hypothetical protein